MEESRTERQQLNTGIGVGGSSVLAIFVVLCLTTFAVLSLVSARADLRLSQKTAQSVTDYYQADAKAQTLLADLAQAARTSGEAGLPQAAAAAAQSVGATWEKAGEGLFTFLFRVSVTETQTLEALVDLAPAVTGSAPRVLSYRVMVEGQTEQNGITVWDGKGAPGGVGFLPPTAP